MIRKVVYWCKAKLRRIEFVKSRERDRRRWEVHQRMVCLERMKRDLGQDSATLDKFVEFQVTEGEESLGQFHIINLFLLKIPDNSISSKKSFVLHSNSVWQTLILYLWICMLQNYSFKNKSIISNKTLG